MAQLEKYREWYQKHYLMNLRHRLIRQNGWVALAIGCALLVSNISLPGLSIGVGVSISLSLIAFNALISFVCYRIMKHQVMRNREVD